MLSEGLVKEEKKPHINLHSDGKMEEKKKQKKQKCHWLNINGPGGMVDMELCGFC